MSPLPADLPLLRCPRHLFGLVSAEADAAPWPEVPAMPLRETVSGGEPQQKTWIKVAWSPEALRILFYVEDTYVWHTMTERDAPLYKEEVVEVFLDPVGDLQTYFEFEVNPVNAVLDLVVRPGKEELRKDFQWRCGGLQTAVQRSPAGWCAELSIPFASLGAAPHGNWRANFYRIDRPRETPTEYSAWSPTGRPKFHIPERFGILEFEGG